MEVLWLRGREHTRLGELTLVAHPPLAAAISLGGAPKLYEHVDPNEDAALIAAGAHGFVLAVADGHGGYAGAEAALAELGERALAAWTENERGVAAWRAELEAVFRACHERVLRLASEPERGEPRSTLTVAVLRPREDLLAVAAVGDSHAFRVARTGVEEIVPARRDRVHFLGRRGEGARPAVIEPRIELLELGASEAVVLATDGISELGIGLENPAAGVAEAARAAASAPASERAARLAQALSQAALDAQRRNEAGDNVAVAAAWLGHEPPRSAA